MKQQFINALFIAITSLSFAQTTFKLDVVAEGNFGSTTGDVFRRNTTVNPATTSTGVYQQTNATTGFDVLQDMVVLGNRALIAEKPSGAGRVVIASYPDLTEIHTFSTSNAPQTIGFASATKAYVSMGNPSGIRVVDLVNNSMTPISDPNNDVSTYSSNMVYANGKMYVELGSKIIKIDTLTNAVTGVITPNIGSIKGITYDAQGGFVWLMNGSGSLVSIDIANNDALSTTIATGASGTQLLRNYDGKLYFWSLGSKQLFVYDVSTPPSLPLSSIYTSSLPGASWSFGYGRSFDIDQNTGDFAICSADGFIAPAPYEVVDGTSFSVIETGTIAGCAIPNKCFLKTYTASSVDPVPDFATLPTITEECSATLTAPTADGGAITGTTSDPVVYNTQGSFTVTWSYDNGSNSVTQTQSVVIDDLTAPVADITTLEAIDLACNTTLTTFPTATDNCDDAITATTTDPLMYAATGNYTITWTYIDAAGNVSNQDQVIQVNCSTTGVSDLSSDDIRLYPNPAQDVIIIETNGEQFEGKIVNTKGQEMMQLSLNATTNKVVVKSLPRGLYYVQLHGNNRANLVYKLIVQ